MTTPNSVPHTPVSVVGPTIYRLGIVSDLHALSQYALVPPRFWPQGAELAAPSAAFYRYVWQCWQHFVASCPPLDALIVNGDLIEGETPTPKSANDALTDNILMQADACVEALRPLRDKANRLWLVRGTPFHDSKFFEALELIGERLGAEAWGGAERRTGYVLEAEWQGLHINATHHMTSGWLYLGGGADRTALLARAAEAEGKTCAADVIIRSHLHRKVLSKVRGKWIVFTPAWKLINPHAIKVMEYYRALESSDLGAVVLETDGAGSVTWREFDYLPYRSKEKKL